MDKSWMNIAHRLSDPRYELGVNEFLDFAYRNKQVSSKVPCPCKDCNNYRKHSRPTILRHLMQRGITVSYENWIHHGEPYDDLDDSDDDMPISEDSEGDNDMDDDDDLDEMLNNIGESRGGVNWHSSGEPSSTLDKDVETLRLLLDESHQELYTGCQTFSKFSFTITILHLKTKSGWTIKSFDSMLDVFRKALPTPSILDKEQERITLILCKLERIFPQSFFDIMVHLLIHLPYEAKIGGPPEYRWMFPFERKMRTLKGYVKNQAHPEGYIAQRYIENECLTFCSMYLNNVETAFNKVERNNEMTDNESEISIFSCKGRPLGSPQLHDITEMELKKIHTYILNNRDELEELINTHKVELEEENYDDINELHDKQFSSWIRQRNKLRSEEAAGSGTPAEICFKVLKRVPGHLRGRSAPKKEILAVGNLRAIVELEKNKSAALEEKLKEVAVEQDDMNKCMGLMMQEIERLKKLVPDKSG